MISALRSFECRAFEASWLVAALVLVPYATVPLPMTLGHRVQAALILGLVTAFIVTSWTRGVGAGPRFRPSHPLLVGAVLWGVAAIVGVAVAVTRANESVLVVGQFLSMALLPLGVAAGWNLGRDLWREITRGIVVAGFLIAAVHLIYWGFQAAGGIIAPRLLLPKLVNPGGIALLGLLLTLARAGGEQAERSRARWLPVAVFAVLLVGAGSRGLWLVTPPALVLMALLVWKWNVRCVARALGLLVLVSLALGLLASPLLAWWYRPRPAVATLEDLAGYGGNVGIVKCEGEPAVCWLPGVGESFLPFPGRVPVAGGRGHRLVGRLSGRGDGLVFFHLIWFDGAQRVLGQEVIVAGLGSEQRVMVHGVAPSSARLAAVSLAHVGPEGGDVQLRELVLEHLGSPFLTVAGGMATGFLERWWSGVEVLAGRKPAAEPALAYRVRETRHLVGQVRRGRWSERLLGHGLGATSPYSGYGFDAEGRWSPVGRIHYIHNFYVFALFKLGGVGLILVLSALACWLGWSVARALLLQGSAQGRFHSAMAAAWAGYALLSLTSPDILNFRLAPIWGLLLAAGIRAGDSSVSDSEAPGDGCT